MTDKSKKGADNNLELLELKAQIGDKFLYLEQLNGAINETRQVLVNLLARKAELESGKHDNALAGE